MDRVAIWPICGAGLLSPFPLAAGKRRAARMFRWLEALQPSGVTDLSAAVEQFIRQAPSRGVAVVVSDFYDLGGPDGGARGALAKLVRAGFEVSAVQVLGAADDAPGLAGRLDLVDGETGRVTRGRVAARVRREYESLLAAERMSIASLLATAGGAFALAPPGRAMEDVLLRDLRRAGVVE
jgi:hypothetical protein